VDIPSFEPRSSPGAAIIFYRGHEMGVPFQHNDFFLLRRLDDVLRQPSSRKKEPDLIPEPRLDKLLSFVGDFVLFNSRDSPRRPP